MERGCFVVVISQTPPLPNELPVVPLRAAVVLPMTVAPLGVSRALSIEAVNKAQGGMRVLVEGVSRARAEFLQIERSYMSALIKPMPEAAERSLEIDAHVRRLQE